MRKYMVALLVVCLAAMASPALAAWEKPAVTGLPDGVVNVAPITLDDKPAAGDFKEGFEETRDLLEVVDNEVFVKRHELNDWFGGEYKDRTPLPVFRVDGANLTGHGNSSALMACKLPEQFVGRYGREFYSISVYKVNGNKNRTRIRFADSVEDLMDEKRPNRNKDNRFLILASDKRTVRGWGDKIQEGDYIAFCLRLDGNSDVGRDDLIAATVLFRRLGGHIPAYVPGPIREKLPEDYDIVGKIDEVPESLDEVPPAFREIVKETPNSGLLVKDVVMAGMVGADTPAKSLPVFRSRVLPGAVGVFTFYIWDEPLMGAKVSEVRLAKVKDASSKKDFTRVEDPADLGDGKFMIVSDEDEEGNVVIRKGSDVVQEDDILILAIRDGCDYDMDGSANGEILDPSFSYLVDAATGGGGDGGGGCATGFAPAAALLLAPLFLLLKR